MSYFLPYFFSFFLLISAGIQGIRCLILLDNLRIKIIDTWEGEYETKLCAEIFALGKNLDDSATFLAKTFPDKEKEAFLAAANAKATLSTLYESTILPDKNGLCHYVKSFKMSATAFRQINPDLPEYWPNWTTRILDFSR